MYFAFICINKHVILYLVFPSNQTLLQHKVTQDNPQLSVIRKFDEIYQQQHRYQNAMQPFHHQKQQNHSFRITNTYKENFLRSQETNSFRIPTQGDWHEINILQIFIPPYGLPIINHNAKLCPEFLLKIYYLHFCCTSRSYCTLGSISALILMYFHCTSGSEKKL